MGTVSAPKKKMVRVDLAHLSAMLESGLGLDAAGYLIEHGYRISSPFALFGFKTFEHFQELDTTIQLCDY